MQARVSAERAFKTTERSAELGESTPVIRDARNLGEYSLSHEQTMTANYARQSDAVSDLLKSLAQAGDLIKAGAIGRAI